LFGADPDIAFVQLIFLAGLIMTSIAVLALPPGAAGPRGRYLATVATVVGLALAGTGLVLARTATVAPGQGTVIPSLSTGSSPLPFTPVCDTTGPLPVCVHPAYRNVLSTISSDLAAVTSQLAGLPGAPTSVAIGLGPAGAGGDRNTLSVAPPNSQGPMTADQIRSSVRFDVVRAVTAQIGDATATPAEQAIARGILLVAGEPMDGRLASPHSSGAQTLAAARRFAALPATTRHDWLATHLRALQAGTITLGELP
jgi:hypothetical protein